MARNGSPSVAREPLLLAVLLMSAIVAVQVMVGYRTAASGMDIVGAASLAAVGLLALDALGVPERLASLVE